MSVLVQYCSMYLLGQEVGVENHKTPLVLTFLKQLMVAEGHVHRYG